MNQKYFFNCFPHAEVFWVLSRVRVYLERASDWISDSLIDGQCNQLQQSHWTNNPIIIGITAHIKVFCLHQTLPGNGLTSYRLLLYRLRTVPTENTAFIVGGACLPSCFLAIEVYSSGADYLENTSTLLLTACVCWTVYRAVAWQCLDAIRYNMYIIYNQILWNRS
jgi:hypothetical protein